MSVNGPFQGLLLVLALLELSLRKLQKNKKAGVKEKSKHEDTNYTQNVILCVS